MASDLFLHLEKRSKELLEKFILPIIEVENDAMAKGEPFPDPDYDAIAAFRLLFHAELEGYFEKKALRVVDTLESGFKGDKVHTKDFAALAFLHMTARGVPAITDTPISRARLKQMAQEALGFGRQFIKDNNGIKEASIFTLSALMGFFPDELDDVLVTELNQYGKNRGDVAHDSWVHKMDTFDSAEIEKTRLTKIVNLIEAFYES